MKKFLLPLLILILSIGCLTAQISNYYSFSSTTGTYTTITGNPITTILGDNVLSSALDIGFSFPYGLNSYTQVKMSSNGFLYLGTIGTSTSQANSLVSTTVCPVVAPLWDNLNLTGGAAAYVTEGEAPNRVFTCQWTACRWNNLSTITFDFQAKLYENGKIEFVYGNATGTPTNPSASIGINMTPGGSDYYMSITPGTPASSSSTTEMSTITSFPGNGVIYDFNPVIPAPNDMACQSITGNLTPTQGVISRYRVNIRNTGSNPQTDYLVKIMAGDTELASIQGPVLQPLTTATVSLVWTPAITGDISIYGKVILVGDTITVNNQSTAINLMIQEPGITMITIGDGSQTAMMPMDMYYRNSLFETIYQSTEIDTNGMITGVSFYNNFVSNLAAMPTKIWLGTTTQANLSAGWIASTQLTQVFDGLVDYPTGQNTVHISFTTPFTYTGSNLVMLVNRPIEALSYNTGDLFQCQTVGTNRSRNVYSSTTTYDAANPPATGSTLSGQFPRTSFSYSPNSPNPVFGISPSVKDWGNVRINSINTQSFIMVNSGSSDLTISSVTLEGSEMFSLSGLNELPFVIQAGQSSSFICTYHPIIAGFNTTMITISDNLNGVRTDHIVNVQGTCIDPTIYALPYTQNFDGVTTPGLPIDWLKYVPATSNGSVTTVTSVIIAPNSSPNSGDLYNNTDNANSILLIAPPLAETLSMPATQIRFWARGYVANYSLSVGVLSDPLDPATYFEIQSFTLTATYTEYTVPLSAYTGTGRYISFKHGLGGTYRGLYVDDITIESTPTNDLAAQSVLGFTLPMQGVATTYAVTIFNHGSTPQTNYTVGLYTDDDTEVASTTGLTIEPGSSLSFDLSWTPLTQEATGLYGKVTLTGDQNLENDVTPLFAINVLPAGSSLVNVGTGEQTARLPFDLNRRNSLYETIYFQDELNFVGNINGIVLYNTFADNCPGMLTQVWIGTTSLGDLSGGWIPSTDLTEVYNTVIPFPIGLNSVAIFFSQPFLYGGGENLVIMFNRPTDTTTYSINDRFLCQTVGTNRALSASSNTITYDPANPPTGTIPIGQFPQTNFIVLPAAVGQMQGNVYGNDNQPLTGAIVQVEGSGQAITDSFGNYSINNVVVGDHEVTASHAGYQSQAVTVTITEGNTITQNFTLSEIATAPTNVVATQSVDHASVNLTWLGADLPDRGKSATSHLKTVKTTSLSRTLLGYQVWRLINGQESNESSWIQLTDATINQLNYTDATWSNLSEGTYKWAIKAVYTGNVLSTPTFSNTLITPEIFFGTLSGIVRNSSTNTPISGATISSGGYSAISDAGGNYSLLLPQGNDAVQCVASGYQPATQNVIIAAGQQYTLNFLLEVTSVSDPQAAVTTELLGNYPNPFTGSTLLSFTVKEPTAVQVDIFNIKGQVVRTLVNESKNNGIYKVTWDGKDQEGNKVSSGIYYYKMNAGTYTSTRKMILMK
jgi:hypothetical protein